MSISNADWYILPETTKRTLGSIPQDLYRMHMDFGFHDVKLNKEHLKGRLDFIQEELNEAYQALKDNDADGFVDAHIDMMVVAQGTLDLGRVNTWKAWDEVLVANCAKVPGKNDKRHSMQGMDLTKPEGWTAPSHIDNVGILPEIMMHDHAYLAARYEEEKAELNPKHRRRALEILDECKELMLRKADDYNSAVSPVRTIDYYRGAGLYDLFHMLTVKYLRIKSLVYKLYHGGTVKNESIVESLKDNIVFSAMTVEFVEGTMDGQEPEQRMFGEFTK